MAVKLRNLRTGETVDTVLRRHWIVFVMLGVYALWGLMMSMFLLWIFGFTTPIVLLNVIFWMYYSMFLYINWLNHELDLIVVTNNRVVCVEQKSFLNRTVGECTLDKIQEVGVETKGILANIFDYGTITIETAGSTNNFDMTFSPHPMEKSRHLNNLADRYKEKRFTLAGNDTSEWAV